MDFQKIKTILRTRIEPGTTAVLSVPIFVIAGSLFSFFGAFAGFAVGMMVPLPVDFGGLPGYEGSGTFFGVVGVGFASLFLVTLWVRDAVLRKRLVIGYLCLWIVDLIATHLIVLSGTEIPSPVVMVAPVILTGVLAYLLQRLPVDRQGSVMRMHAVVCAACAAALLGVLLSMSMAPNELPPAEDPSINFSELRASDEGFTVVATRKGAQATIVIRNNGALRGGIVHMLHLEKKYAANVNAQNRFGFPFLPDGNDYPTDPATGQMRVEPPAEISNDRQRADARLAIDAARALRREPDISKRYDADLLRLSRELAMMILSFGTASSESMQGDASAKKMVSPATQVENASVAVTTKPRTVKPLPVLVSIPVQISTNDWVTDSVVIGGPSVTHPVTGPYVPKVIGRVLRPSDAYLVNGCYVTAEVAYKNTAFPEFFEPCQTTTDFSAPSGVRTDYFVMGVSAKELRLITFTQTYGPGFDMNMYGHVLNRIIRIID